MKKIGLFFIWLCILFMNPSFIVANTDCSEWQTGWNPGFIVDEFGEKLYDSIVIKGCGRFQNSATSNSSLYYEMLIYNDGKFHLGLFLYEYSLNNSPVYFYGSSGSGSYLIMKNSKGEKYECVYLSKWNNVGISIMCTDEVINFIRKSSGDIKVFVRDNHSSKYHFSFTANGFNIMHDFIKK